MISVEGLRFRYAASSQDALVDVDWHLNNGDFTLLAGQSGSGKSTLLRCLNGLIPRFHGGFFAGNILIDGRNTRDTPPRDLATTVGTVFQDPESQFVTDTAEDEITFTLENLGYRREEIPGRISSACAGLEIEHLRTRRISTLSGGERQMVALAAAIAPQPRTILLDEPTSQLDPRNANSVIDMLVQLNSQQDLAIVVAEHRLEQLLPRATRLLLASEGCILEIAQQEARPALQSRGLLGTDLDAALDKIPATPGDELASVRELGFSYGSRKTISDISLQIREGESIALTGSNGSGKTTLLKHLIGLLQPDTGSIEIAGKPIADQPVQQIARSVGYVPQQATLMLHQESTVDELQFTLDALNRSGSIACELATFQLDGFADRHPLDLSGGERQRLAIAAISVARPRILLLDEPTRGLPWSMKQGLAAILRSRAREGCAVIVATHDEDFVRAFADRRIVLDEGAMLQDEPLITGPGPDVSRSPDVNPLLTTPNFD